MNRALIITIGIVILLLIVGLWVYLIAYGAPEKPREVFTNLGFLAPAETEVRIVDPNGVIENPDTQLALGGSNLQQLTTRAVAGFAFLPDNHTVRYVERGTGYVYEIDLTAGTEKQISLTTIPHTSEAVFSPDGNALAITTYEGYSRTVAVGSFVEGDTLELSMLPEDAHNVVFEDNNTLYFSIEDGGATLGYSYSLKTLSKTTVFTIDLSNLSVLWGFDVTGVYVQTMPSPLFESALYRVEQNTLTPVTEPALGATALVGGEVVINSTQENDGFHSTAYIDGNASPIGFLMVPEKCDFSPRTETGIWCASPLQTEGKYLENWYKGAVTSEDYLWLTDLDENISVVTGDLPKLAGKTIDVHHLTVSEDGGMLLLNNKLDGTLWLYRVPL